ncbi:DDRGK domain containing 1 [Phyllostomus discolor]|uniref:DDRGK domain containing 1 n=1 Tax=Phyllostomus discolor TaxID=89673 RepID=A0A833ZB60_9CHIR|nr:DDRGK domain containing 1 [Phyllostomus discolor]
MVAPVVVYLVAAALLVGLIFFLTRRRGPAAAASGEPLHNEEAAGRAAQPRPLEPEDQTGVIDDRGKFIYITPEELAAVANFIRQRGRVSITELAQASNSLISWGREPPAQAPA